MAVDLTVPTWLKDYVMLWSDRLGLTPEWEISVSLEQCIAGRASVQAQCECIPNINRAYLRFRADAEDTAEWRRAVVHELLHVKHGRIDHYLEEAVFPETGAFTHAFAYKAYLQYYESFIHSMACALYDMWAVKEADPDRVAKVPKREK